MNNNNKEYHLQNRFSHNKTPSLRDLMLGKKVVKELPENFFEKVLDLELKLKRDFQMHTLQELVSFYSVIYNLTPRQQLNTTKAKKIINTKTTKVD
jgi:hypothetical protein